MSTENDLHVAICCGETTSSDRSRRLADNRPAVGQKILIIEDEVAIADALAYALGAEGFLTAWQQLARPALEQLRQGGVDLVVLDVGLPDMTGFELCKALRKFSDVPVVFLTARAEEIDRVLGLEIGADDYMVKPFSPRELVARVRAILKRSRAPDGAAQVSAADTTKEFYVDVERLQIFFCGQLLKLTALEFRLLQQLLHKPGQVFSREQLLAAVGVPAASGYERNIDTHIKALRAKLRDVNAEREPLQTHRGFGYSYQCKNSA
jgi:two-component system, OmpR family, catabolic regulation response regulator CreB